MSARPLRVLAEQETITLKSRENRRAVFTDNAVPTQDRAMALSGGIGPAPARHLALLC